MKCHTVTETGVTTGIHITPEPYAHVGVGNPDVIYDYRRVAVHEALAGTGSGTIVRCSMVIDRDESDSRRVSYKLMPATGKDDDQALVLLNANCASPAGRTFYDYPRDTFTLANGWYSRGPRVSHPVDLIIVRKDAGEVRVYRVEDISRKPDPVFALSFDGAELHMKPLESGATAARAAS